MSTKRTTTVYNISDNSQTELQRNLFSSSIEEIGLKKITKKNEIQFLSHQSELRDGSAQGPLLAVGDIYWRERERDNQSARQRHRERFINFIMCSKKVAIITALWESHKSRRCYVTARCMNTCGLTGSS